MQGVFICAFVVLGAGLRNNSGFVVTLWVCSKLGCEACAVIYDGGTPVAKASPDGSF